MGIMELNECQGDESDELPEYCWNDDVHAAKNYRELGAILAQTGDLYRRPEHDSGLLLIRSDGQQATIKTAIDLAPVIADRVAVAVYLNGKPKGNKVSAQHLNSMLRSTSFLENFVVVDRVADVPVYLPDFTLCRPGYNDGGSGHRILYTGGAPDVCDSFERMNAFLDVMAFTSNADRTNAVAAALTVQLRDHWPGGKPIVLVTATKSHAGKETVILFASGQARQCSISYQATDWALERSFVGAAQKESSLGVMVIDNARLGNRDDRIASAFVERFATDPEPLLFSTGTGPAVRRRNDLVLAISTNYGSVSEDILNRSLPIHLSPVGLINDRVSLIGNPKLEYLPENRNSIAAELRGMIERWRQAGCPLDHRVRHPFSVWAKTIGGVLSANGFSDFLANYGTRKVSDDPLRHGLALLGAKMHGEEWHRTEDWARLIVREGLTKQLIACGDRDSGEGLKRGTGAVMARHREEIFTVETEAEALSLKLERHRGRFGQKQPHYRYRFLVIDRKPLADDDAD